MNIRKAASMTVAAIVGVGVLSMDEGIIALKVPHNVMTQANAIIGRPLTPRSYAGVARRTTRRAVRRGAYYGAYHY
jgi:hypothetical protein